MADHHEGSIRISVQRRVLLLLHTHFSSSDDYEVPDVLSQKGIGRELSLRQTHVSRALTELRSDGLVEERSSHIKGATRKMKAYFLTRKGANYTQSYIEELGSTKVPVRLRDGRLKLRTASQALDLATRSMGRTVTYHELFNDLYDGSEISLSGGKGEIAGRDTGAPVNKHFFGRIQELSTIGDFLDERSGLFLVVTSIAGQGKTALLSDVASNYRKGPVHFTMMSEWTEPWKLIHEWADLLEDLGRSRTASFLRGREDPGLLTTVDRLKVDLTSSNMLIIVDDIHKARGSVIELFRLIRERCGGSSGFKFLIGTRRSPDFYGRKDLVATGIVREMELGGLDPLSSGQLLAERGIPEEERELAYKLTKGHPLALELYTPGIDPLSSGRDLDDYLREEVLGELDERELNILRTASVYESPVVAEGLFDGVKPHHDLLSDLCKRALLRAFGDGTYDLHDLLKENLRKNMTEDEREKALSHAVDHLSRRGSEREIIHYLRILEGYDQKRLTTTLLEEGEFLVNRGHTLVYDLLETIREGELHGRELVKYLVLYSDLKVLKGDLKGAEERLVRALSLCDSLLVDAEGESEKHEIIGLVSRVLTRRGEIARTRGLHAATIDINRKNVAYNRKYGDAPGLGKALNNLAVAYNDRGELDKALETLENAREVFEKSGDPTSAALVEANIADIHITRRDTERARKHLEAAASHSPKLPMLRGKLKRKIGLARLRLGDLDRARDDLNTAYSSFSEAGDREGCREVTRDLFRFAMAAGKRKDALHFLEKGKDLLKARSEGGRPSGEPLVMLLADRLDYTMRWDRKKGPQRARDLGRALGRQYPPKNAILHMNSLLRRYDDPVPLIEFLEALGSCFEGLSDPHPGIIVDLRRGELLIDSGRSKEAGTLLKKTASRARKVGFEKGWKKADSLLRRIA